MPDPAAHTDLRQWKRGEQRAPHKPLLLLLALARITRGEPRLTPFSELEADLSRLLREFGPPRRTQKPHYPFWRLQNDGLWEIPQAGSVQTNTSGDIRLTDARRLTGGLPESRHETLRADPRALQRMVAEILDAYFPPSYHDDLLDAVGMHWQALIVPRARRDPGFRLEILRSYGHRCAVCGYDGRLDGDGFAPEAAHVRWHSEGGPDTLDNGVALCALHHRAFDRGALGLSEDHRILVSQSVHGGPSVDEWLVRYHAQPLGGPQPGLAPPALAHVRWHAREVFRSPARAN